MTKYNDDTDEMYPICPRCKKPRNKCKCKAGK